MFKWLFVLYFIFIEFGLSQDRIQGYFDSHSNFFIQDKKEFWISKYKYGFAEISKKGYTGIVDSLGNIIVPLDFDRVFINKNAFYAKKSNKYFCFDHQGNINNNDFFGRHVEESEAHWFYPEYIMRDIDYYGKPYGEGFFVHEQYKYDQTNFKYGVAFQHENGNWLLLKKKYEKAYPFSDGLALVKSGELWGAIDEKGNEIIEPQYQSGTYSFRNGITVAVKNGRSGVINKDNKIIIPFEYQLLFLPRQNGKWIAAKKNGKFGYIDLSGNVKVDFIYDDAFADIGYLNVRNGNELYSLNYELNRFQNYQLSYDKGYRFMDYDNERVYEDEMGNIVYENIFESHPVFREGLALIKKDGKYGYIDQLGEIIIEPIYENAKNFNLGIALVMRDKKWIYIDKKGNERMIVGHIKSDEVNNNRFDMNDYGYDRFQCDSNKIGMINSDLSIVIPCKYDNVRFNLDYIYTSNEGFEGLYDFSFNEIFPPIYEKIYPITYSHFVKNENSNFILVTKDKKIKIATNKNKILQETEFDSLEILKGFSGDKYVFPFELNEKYGYIDKQTLKIHPAIYNSIGFNSDNNILILNLNQKKIEIKY